MILITLGNGVEFYIDSDQEMGIRKVSQGHTVADISLGHASEKQLDMILLHMGSLRIHTERNQI